MNRKYKTDAERKAAIKESKSKYQRQLYEARRVQRRQQALDLGYRPIPGLAADYFATPDGQIYSSKSARILKPGKLKNGYLQVKVVMADGTSKLKLVSRLVHEAFIGPIPDGYDVDHLDSCRTRNVPSNLEAVTHSENMRRSWVRRLILGMGWRGNPIKVAA